LIVAADRTLATVNGKEYQIGRMPALEQLHVARRLMPCLAALANVDTDKVQSLLPQAASETESTNNDQQVDKAFNQVALPIAQALAGMSDDQVNYIIVACLKVCYYKQDTGWARMTNNTGQIMNADLSLPDLLGVTVEVIKENLGGFFPGGLPS
jgi:hypothetical protein